MFAELSADTGGCLDGFEKVIFCLLELPFLLMYKVDRPRKNLFVGSYYSREEVEKLLEVLKDDPLYPMVFVDVYYDLRRSELLGLEWDSVDFVRNTLSVEHKVCRDNENGDDRDISISSELKTRNSRRTLPLIPAVREVLEAEKKKQEHYRKIFKAEYIGKYSKMVFVDPVGNLYTPDYVTRHFEVVLKSNGLRPIRFHAKPWRYTGLCTCGLRLRPRRVLFLAYHQWNC